MALQQAEAQGSVLKWPWARTQRPRVGPFLRQRYDLFVLAGLALLLPALTLVPLPLLRLPLGLALVFIAPGYALTAALFVGRKDLDGVTRAALSCGLSVAVLPVLALLLHGLAGLSQQPRPLQPLPLVLTLSAWILACCGLALWRRHGLPAAAERYVPWGGDRPWGWPPLRPRGRGWALLGALALAGPLAAWGGALITADRSARLTEFYVLGRGGLAEDFPRSATVGDELWTTVGIANREGQPRTYRVEVWVDEPGDQARRTRVAEHGPIAVEPGQAWEGRVAWRMPGPGEDQRVEIWLLAGDTPRPYRQLRLWLQVTPQLAPGQPGY
jgi:uncharacterized membrane protein